ncbi:bifunctional hydroxymethylpyrimidine kinase/phosphomethylpyrimidine kinase [Kaistia dalseonensis]|uniref:hydroxymethylpyrimidine kinase n=1 Tax=Kaistia dalseonensis TaxID=410840 RepID=A0ABU0H1D0_9HYPH|nr:bifunctional hydroxymethylpyrimidine kinase/phosphomethylpyrimidine kinase [Kaistia dalseonensis]MCX5493541.1 bifunctional hydroxymethylpyrimidine kinase/phosphomethylpyrimidine kinase [Kaistia dalseonensis]MDQ0436101.1 hydroxymethylpyrimidine/phosphomethylpyrimidine kinase [Kaistia dalseonensis]
MTAIAVTIAGSDSGGGAGIQADLKTFSALGVYGASVIAALTAQNTLGVTAIHDVPAAFVTAQIDAVFSDLAVNAVKIGMLSHPDVIRAVAAGLDRYDQRKVVLDPVMVATSGDMLIHDESVELMVAELLPRALVITPNLREAARLLGTKMAMNDAEMEDQARALLAMGPGTVLLKGGHGTGAESSDFLLTQSGAHWFSAPRIPTLNTHGTGCTLSSAIAAGLARGIELVPAVEAAKLYITEAIENADRLDIGKGHGPVHHFYRWW